VSDRIEDELLAYLRENFLPRGARSALTVDDDLLETATVDSVGLLTMVEHIEQTYSIRVADEDLLPENFLSVRRVAEFVRRHAAVESPA